MLISLFKVCLNSIFFDFRRNATHYSIFLVTIKKWGHDFIKILCQKSKGILVTSNYDIHLLKILKSKCLLSIIKYIVTYLQSAKKKNENVPSLQHILQAKIGRCLSNNSNHRLRQPIQRTNVSAIANAAM